MHNRFTHHFMMKTEQQNIVTRTVKKKAVMQRLSERAVSRCFRTMILLFVPYLLAGCVSNSASGELAKISEAIMPEQRVIDYHPKGCDVIWNITKTAAMENSLYWLRLIDCTERLSPTEARDKVKQFMADDWSQVFKQSILINHSIPSVAERRSIIENLNRYSTQFPPSLQPLLQLWRDQQYLKISLAEQKSKYQRLQSDSETKIDRLKEARTRLEYELHSISRKLENLTDIERQLSSRKQSQNVSSASVETEYPADESGNKINESHPESHSKQLPERKSETKTEDNFSEEKGAEVQ
ncbi:two-component system QseEF-associated lipoprotein QseG [Xenorhabdus sp. KK7.4]|uniref:two-component system QseEF-associated lipoprotein QseG n=2 Tax=Xenorhabdus sp. KK7.4 TaxID=1851572 RepID=UPI001F4D62A5|nr:two-component system QseEF-associated lipoprotein QseG [Xenorhabdus sp. KK7.4]